MLYRLPLPLPHAAVGAERDTVHHVPHRGGELSALAISLTLGPWMIQRLPQTQIGRVVRADGRRRTDPRPARPRWAACSILTAALVPTLSAGHLTNVNVWIALRRPPVTVTIGLRGHYLKIVRRIAPRSVAAIQVGVWQFPSASSSACAAGPATTKVCTTRLVFPFFKPLIPDLGWLCLPFAVCSCSSRGSRVRGQPDQRSRWSRDHVFAIAATAYTALAYVTVTCYRR